MGCPVMGYTGLYPHHGLMEIFPSASRFKEFSLLYIYINNYIYAAVMLLFLNAPVCFVGI